VRHRAQAMVNRDAALPTTGAFAGPRATATQAASATTLSWFSTEQRRREVIDSTLC